MPPSDWNVPATLASVYGDLALNAATGDRYILMREGCDMWQDVRAQQLNVPTEDGSLIQERFVTGTRLVLKVGLWFNDEPACYEDLTRMVDTISKHAQSMVKAAFAGRFLWDPEGDDIRLLDYMQMSERMQWDWSQIVPQVTLTFDSPFPYAIDFTQLSTGAGTLNNVGNTTMFPVFQVTGGGAFTLSNNTTGLSIVFTGSYSGYAEIDTFRNTIYENGDGANLKDGIDVENSDFWGLVPGNNSVSISGGSVTVLWQAAWV